MIKTSYRISEKAIEDIENIWQFTLNRWDQNQADRYYNLIISEIEYIVANFDIGRPMDHVRAGYRISKVKSHLIFFRKASDNVIEVIRILHEKMDIENRLG